jgi:dTDP-4-dehydrorhamnose 3,5-epimerase
MTDAALDRPASALEGVRYGAIARFADPRGSFREIWRDDTFGAIEPSRADAPTGSPVRFVQANLSTSASGVLRGLHLHQRQLDHWVAVSGRAFVALVDVRPMLRGDADRPLVETRELVADEWVDIPIGIAHGFLALEPLQLIYLVTNAYDGSDELGFAWDDPLAAVAWPAVPESPDGRPILSDRDRSNPSLSELVERLRANG